MLSSMSIVFAYQSNRIKLFNGISDTISQTSKLQIKQQSVCWRFGGFQGMSRELLFEFKWASFLKTEAVVCKVQAPYLVPRSGLMEGMVIDPDETMEITTTPPPRYIHMFPKAEKGSRKGAGKGTGKPTKTDLSNAAREPKWTHCQHLFK